MVATAVQKVHEVGTGVKVEEDHDALMKATKESKASAMNEARTRLVEFKIATQQVPMGAQLLMQE